MTVYYEKVVIDAGHEYIESCQVLFETQQGWLIKKVETGTEQFVRKGADFSFVRRTPEKVGVYPLVRRLIIQVDEEYDVDTLSPSDDWIESFVDRLIETGALKDGQYEIPN